MRRGMSLAALFGAVLSVFATSSANATLVSIGFSTGGAPVLLAGPNSSGNATFSESVGNFAFNSLTASVGPLPNLLNAVALNSTSTSAGTLNLFFTIQDVTNPAGITAFFNTVTANFFAENPAHESATFSTFVDPGDGRFTTVDPVGTATLTHNGPPPFPGGFTSGGVNTGPLYSLTEEITLTATAANQGFLVTANVSAIPEPATWALMGIGFGCLGLMAYRRRGNGTVFRIA